MLRNLYISANQLTIYCINDDLTVVFTLFSTLRKGSNGSLFELMSTIRSFLPVVQLAIEALAEGKVKLLQSCKSLADLNEGALEIETTLTCIGLTADKVWFLYPKSPLLKKIRRRDLELFKVRIHPNRKFP
ncbi:hypothetical protein L596_017799 [Steinernema carpocapsae]|uniref:Uncharacterized protein n=1 Tax=Steinernema carpocapsae TaxID=34508 RepID=A0A4U5N330_STECR|nr:hypothetical protein L596_017799 [Steinernema carpocapsae]